jgi:flagella basal body P-ring formation protein FlgA
MRLLATFGLIIAALPAGADSVVTNRTIRAQTILTAADLAMAVVSMPGALTAPDQAIGQETRVTLYAGRPIRAGDIGPPAIIDRNQIVPLAYRQGGLAILTEARALERGGVGDLIRVMNLESRNSLTARVQSDGSVLVE